MLKYTFVVILGLFLKIYTIKQVDFVTIWKQLTECEKAIDYSYSFRSISMYAI